MKVSISKIGNINTNKNDITICAFCSGPDLRMDDINVSLKGVLLLGEDKLSCTVNTISKKKNGSYGLTLKVPDSIALYSLIHPYHHKSSLDFTLIMHENVDPELHDEADGLLDFLSQQTGINKGDLLCQLTAFKNFPGKRDLKLVSAKQMPIVIDKMREMLKTESQDEEGTQS